MPEREKEERKMWRCTICQQRRDCVVLRGILRKWSGLTIYMCDDCRSAGEKLLSEMELPHG